MRHHYGPSLSDQGYSPDDIEDPEPPHCWKCGAFLPTPSMRPHIYGYPESVIREMRLGARCRKCLAINWAE